MDTVFKKLSLVLVIFVGSSLQGAFVFKTAGFVFRHRAQVVAAGQQVKAVAVKGIKVIRPTFTRIAEHPQVQQAGQATKAWVAEDPKRAAGVGLGAYVGYRTSGEGVVDTTIGTGLGALAGLTLSTQAARAAMAESYALAVERNVALQTSLAGVRTELAAAGAATTAAQIGRKRALFLARSARQQLRQARQSLSELKNAASSITKTPVATPVKESKQSMSFLELFKAGRSVQTVKPSLVSHNLVPA